MKIAWIVPGGVDRSGERRVIPALLALIERLARRHELQVYALAQEAERGDWPLLGAQVHNLGGPARGRSLRAALAIRREHRRTPFDLVQAIWSGPCGLAAALATAGLATPYAVHLAGGELTHLPDIGYGGLRGARDRWRERWVLRRARAVSGASAAVLAQAAALGITGTHRLPLGVDPARWPPQPPRPRTPGAPLRLVQLASLNRVKDPDCLLQALALLRQRGIPAELELIGEDTRAGQLQARAAELGLGAAVRFSGFLTQAELPARLARADVHVVSSRHEAGPVALLEASLAGLATAGSAVGHLAEWAPEAACVAPPGDAVALAAVLADLADDEPRRLRLAQAAQARALAEDADHCHAGFERLYEELACRP
jgi:glycosyltransferase involved in cell wall biosynthesis